MNRIKIDSKIHNVLNNSKLGIIEANVKVQSSSIEFNEFIQKNQIDILDTLLTNRETTFEIIKETRQAYKVCGKEPSRYRPSAEALLRRLRTKRDLYQINNVVDAINLISTHTHYSIGGFDQRFIEGEITLDIGESTPYDAIGRGTLNIEFMPGLHDSSGFFGTPTSDSIRTMVRNDTENLLLVFYDFYGNTALESALNYGVKIIEKYCFGTSIQTNIIEK